MKKYLLFLGVLFCTTSIFAQEKETNYNKWSFDLGVGLHNISTPEEATWVEDYDLHDFGQFNIGVRYMINEKFGIRGSYGHNIFSTEKVRHYGNRTIYSEFDRGNLEGVVNLGNIFKFSEWSKFIGLSFHGGAGISKIVVFTRYQSKDLVFNVMAGVTPQIKIVDRIAFMFDVSVVSGFGLIKQGQDTQDTDDRSLDSYIFNYSAGFNIYLGNNKTHADWFVPKNDE